jgi:prepilin-type N-terminal cleavage/methylation domain-containing protein
MNIFNTKRHPRGNNGFTLIEIMVAIALFTVVMTISVGALLSLVNANKKAQALKSVMNNLNFALENMSRNMRTGTTYHCGTTVSVPSNASSPNDCSNGGVLLALEGRFGNPNTPADQIIYRFISGRIEKSSNGGATFIPITASEVSINDMKFYVTGTTPGDTIHPRIIMVIRGSAGNKASTQTSFSIQTSVSQRLTDL